MHIIVAGGGKMGSTVIEHLAEEGHDVALIDKNPRMVEEAINKWDITGVAGNAASCDVQREAGAAHADLLIAATPQDEVNMLACMIAKKLGCAHTIARVRNPEYSSQMMFLRRELGLSMIVNPEYQTAREISRTLRVPEAIKVDSFAGGRADIIEVRIGDGSPLIGLSIGQISEKYKVKILVCAVEREDFVTIPDGNFRLKYDDKIYVTGTSECLSRFFRTFKFIRDRIKRVMIVGGGKVSYYLAEQLDKMNMDVRVIERDPERCAFLSETLPKSVTVICGDGLDQNVLLEEGLADSDAFAAMTGMDEENIIVSLYAKGKGLEKIVTKINRSFGDMVAELGLESTVCPKLVVANHIVRYVRAMQKGEGSTVRTLYKLVGNKVEALEFSIDEEAEYLGKPLRELRIKKNILIGCIVHEGVPKIPDGNAVMSLGDSVVVVTAEGRLKNLGDIFE